MYTMCSGTPDDSPPGCKTTPLWKLFLSKTFPLVCVCVFFFFSPCTWTPWLRATLLRRPLLLDFQHGLKRGLLLCLDSMKLSSSFVLTSVAHTNTQNTSKDMLWMTLISTGLQGVNDALYGVGICCANGSLQAEGNSSEWLILPHRENNHTCIYMTMYMCADVQRTKTHAHCDTN